MIHHYITQYEEDGKTWVEAWLQLNFLRWSFCFSRRRQQIKNL